MRIRYVFLADLVAVGSAAFGAFIPYFGWRFFEYRPEFPASLLSRS